MSGDSRRDYRDRDPRDRGQERPPEPTRPPGRHAALGLHNAGPKASSMVAPVAAPRYSSSCGRGPENSAPDGKEDDGQKKTKRRRSHRSRSRGRDRRGAERTRAEKAAPAEMKLPAPPPKPPTKAAQASSDSSSAEESSKEEVAEEPEPAVPSASRAVAVAPKPQTGVVPLWLQAKVDNLSRKAVSFSRALTRAQQALKTSARIAREAAVSFDSELENFQIAQREIDREFASGD